MFTKEAIIRSYKELAKIPSLVGATVNSSGTKINSKWSVRNLDKGKMTKYNYGYTIDNGLNVVGESEFASDVSHELISSVSPRESYRACVREDRDKDAKKQYLEVWRGARLVNSIDLTALDLHGDVYADSEFGVLNWSPDEASVVYVAERKPPKSEPYLKRKPQLAPSGGGEAPPKQGEEHVYKQDWGEQLNGKVLSTIVVCNLQSERLTLLEGLPESWCPGQVHFAPDGQGVVGVAWETEPRRLGLIFCTNRPSCVFHLTLDGKMTKLSTEGVAVRSPRVWDNRAVWLQRSAGGPHHACHQLVTADYKQGGVTTIIDIVDTEVQTANGGSFTGIYSQALPQRCFSGDGNRVVFSTPQQTSVKTYVVDLKDKSVVELKNKGFDGSIAVVDVNADVVVAVCSNMTTPGQLYAARLPPKGKEQEIVWKRISAPIDDVPQEVAKATVSALSLEHPDCSDSVKSFTALYMSPYGHEGKRPLIVWPHGGPHSGFVNSYSIEAAFYATLGLASLRINFRGSSGHGERSIRSLIGHAGAYDVDDCFLALSAVLERDVALDGEKLLLYGGSYGGFVIAHMAARRVEGLLAMVTRNPLIDLASKGPEADNSDGCAVEAGFEFTEAGPASEEQLLAMRRCSPLAHAHRVRAPTALMLGAGDKRVPHYQGLEFARRLKANGVATRIYMYDDNHSLSSVPVEMDNLINGADWFSQHLL